MTGARPKTYGSPADAQPGHRHSVDQSYPVAALLSVGHRTQGLAALGRANSSASQPPFYAATPNPEARPGCRALFSSQQCQTEAPIELAGAGLGSVGLQESVLSYPSWLSSLRPTGLHNKHMCCIVTGSGRVDRTELVVRIKKHSNIQHSNKS